MIVVTGGSGKAGRACIQDLLAHQYEVASVDLARPSDPNLPFSRADLTDFGQTVAALSGIDERVRNVLGHERFAYARRTLKYDVLAPSQQAENIAQNSLIDKDFSERVLFRADFRDYVTPFPDRLFATPRTAKEHGWLHDFVTMAGISFVF